LSVCSMFKPSPGRGNRAVSKMSAGLIQVPGYGKVGEYCPTEL
jgi:hypothetical protein